MSVSTVQHQLQQQSSSSTTTTPMMTIAIPENATFTHTSPVNPQQGRHAFPAGGAVIALESPQPFGWNQTITRSNVNEAAQERVIVLACREFVFDSCTHGTTTTSTTNHSSQRNVNNNQQHCSSCQAKKCCSVVSTLTIKGFLALLDVPTNHQHSPPPPRSSITTISTTTVDNDDVQAMLKRYAINRQKSEQAYLEAEQRVLRLFQDDTRANAVESLRYELLSMVMLFIRFDSKPSGWSRVSLRVRERASMLVQLPWFGALYCTVLVAVRKFMPEMLSVESTASSYYDQPSIAEVDELLQASNRLTVSAVVPVTDVNIATDITLIAVATEFAQRLAASTTRLASINSELAALKSTDNNKRRRITGRRQSRTPTIIDKDITTTPSSSTTTTTTNALSNDDDNKQTPHRYYTRRNSRVAISSSSPSSAMTTTDIEKSNSMDLSTGKRNMICCCCCCCCRNPSHTYKIIIIVLSVCIQLTACYEENKLFTAVDDAFVAMFLNAVERIVGSARPVWQPNHMIRCEPLGPKAPAALVRSVRASDNWLDALALAIGCLTSSALSIDPPRALRLLALIELSEHREHYCEMYGVRFLRDAVDCLVNEQWLAALDTSLMLVFANMLNQSILFFTEKDELRMMMIRC